MENKDIRVRVARPDDAEAIQKIYAPYVKNTAITFEYDIPTVEEMEQRIQQTEETYPFLVATVKKKVVGFAYASTFQDRAAYQWSAQLSVYCDPAYKRQNIGTKLYYVLENFLRDMGYCNACACIALEHKKGKDIVKNESTRFHRSLEYNYVGKFNRIGYKNGKWYDMVWMEKTIAKHKDKPKEPISFAAWREKNDL